eukprot:TRINITY_DN14144_c0_g2_i1.p1 TRINITY_DN14144_c0_g2~~TRINITY_DN14144_c0_g2_i1.p1  ORF type:complete len:176 (+),score=54.71 TRINITY_DN14144_c0_g2_i1:66-593(+)
MAKFCRRVCAFFGRETMQAEPLTAPLAQEMRGAQAPQRVMSAVPPVAAREAPHRLMSAVPAPAGEADDQLPVLLVAQAEAGTQKTPETEAAAKSGDLHQDEQAADPPRDQEEDVEVPTRAELGKFIEHLKELKKKRRALGIPWDLTQDSVPLKYQRYDLEQLQRGVLVKLARAQQ